MFENKKQLTWSKLKVGALITFALFILFLSVFLAGSIEDILSPKVDLYAQISDVKGLRKGAPVWLSGVEIGSIKAIRLHPDYGTMVDISINRDALAFIKKDSKASVLTMGLLGDKYVELSLGSPDAEPARPGDIIKGIHQIELKEVMEAGAVSIKKMNEFMEKMGRLIENIERGEGTIAKFLSDPTIYNNLKETTHNLSVILKDINNEKGTMGMLIKDPMLYNKLLGTTSSAEKLVVKLNEGAEKVIETSTSIEAFTKKLNEGSGSLKMLAEDPALYENLNKASAKLSSILEKVESGEGAAGAFLTDKDLGIEIREIIFQLRELTGRINELTKDIKENPKKYFRFSVF